MEHVLGSIKEQPWPSGNALDSDQHGPGFEAQRWPLVASGRAYGPNARARTRVLSEAPPKPQGTGGNGGKIENMLGSLNYAFPEGERTITLLSIEDEC